MRNLRHLIKTDKYDSGGRCGETKGELINRLVINSNSKLCVEIGVFKGSSLMYFAESLLITGGIVIGIDPYSLENFKNNIPDDNVNDLIYNVLFTEQSILDEIYNNLVGVIQDNNLSEQIILIRDTSENYSHNIKIESIDVLHIDGNHDEDCVSQDILLYLPLVKKGGYVIMDDVNWEWVKKSIDSHLKNKCVLIEEYSDFAIYQKN
jgi:predicted O-methyltransferase YrrM